MKMYTSQFLDAKQEKHKTYREKLIGLRRNKQWLKISNRLHYTDIKPENKNSCENKSKQINNQGSLLL